MSINCLDPQQFPPLNSTPKVADVPTTSTAVIGGPGSGDIGKTVNINTVVGIAPYDLEALVPENQTVIETVPETTSDWVVQGRSKGKERLGAITEEPSALLSLTEEDVKEELEFWKTDVYGFVLGAKPPVDVVEVSFCPNGVFLVRFKTVAARDLVLQQGHFLFDNKPLIVRPWSEAVLLEKSEVKDVPVWVRLHNLPLKFWGKSLPKLAGLLGTFVRCNAATTDKTRLGFARVMIDVKFGGHIPESIKFMDEDGCLVQIKVEFEWKPLLCVKCQRIGHESGKCQKPKENGAQKVVTQQKGKQQWRPKQKAKPTAAPPVVITTTPHVVANAPAPETVVRTPVEKPNQFQVSWGRDGKYHMDNTPARNIIRLSRQEILEAGRSSIKFGQHTFMESLYNARPKVGVGANSSGLTPQGGNFLEYNPQFIHMSITDLGSGYCFWLTMVYAYNGTQERKDLWDKLCMFKRSIQDAWVICGDFNTVLDPATRVYSRLDRVLVNHQWLSDHSSVYAHFYCEGIFYHTPCVLQAFDDKDKKRRSFKYYNMWSQAKNFKLYVQSNWKGNWFGTKMYILTRQLKNLKCHLRKLNKESFDDIDNNFHRAKMNLEYIQDILRGEPQNIQLIEMERDASNSVRFLANASHEFLVQKSKVPWMEKGDSNTKYFHPVIKSRQARNKVLNITNTQGVLCEDTSSIQDAFLQFYTSLLGTSVETRQVMFSIPSHKAAGPDGYSSAFYKDSWDIVGRDIYDAIQDFFHEGKLCYNRRAASPRFMLKVDLQKAYDSVSWAFLEQMMNSLNFPNHMIHLIMECVSTATYSLVLNGDTFGHFKGEKGLRQGDPLSPLLFTVAMEYFSRILAFTTDNMAFKFYPICGKLRIVKYLLKRLSPRLEDLGQKSSPTLADWVPPVGWDKVCSPKDEGGLGIRDSLSWNIAAIGKLIWWIYSCPNKLWVKWIHQVYLKGTDWNDYNPTGDVRWGWKVICRTKTKLAHGYINHQWTLDHKGYSISSGYELIRAKFQKVVWHKVLWNRWCIPKHQFIGWLIARERLQLKDKLLALGIVPDATCLLCGEAEESHLHLFLQCRYSQRILTDMAKVCHVSWPNSNLINWIGVWQGSALHRNIIMCIVLAAFYQIWMQRNKVRVDACLLRPEYMTIQIKKEVKMKLATKSIQGLNINDVTWLNLVSSSL
ncbi:uncharacterized protein LOC141638510 [Silene latifolia]|uniref:uncharacterized protein LOC141638510 n=1 Tax=Silene latifolia TaxID=37657 RepID=UPI003D77408F